MSKLTSMKEAIAQYVPDGSSVAISLALEALIPFAAAHEIIRQQRRRLAQLRRIIRVQRMHRGQVLLEARPVERRLV